jgi:chemotaxis regulatin CheY-phosphate phosphatase CheZ
MNNTNNRSFTQRGRELLEQLKQFIIDVNSNTTNKQAQLNTIISELQEVEQKVSNIHLKFLRKYFEE